MSLAQCDVAGGGETSENTRLTRMIKSHYYKLIHQNKKHQAKKGICDGFSVSLLAITDQKTKGRSGKLQRYLFVSVF